MLTVPERKMIVRLHNQKKTQEFIAGVVGCSQQSVSRWIRESKRRPSLENLPKSGRPTKLTNDVLGYLREKINKIILDKNDDFCSVLTKEIRELIYQEIGELYSLRHVERLMHKMGFSLITPRTMHTKHDQSAVDKFREEFKKKSSQNIWVMS